MASGDPAVGSRSKHYFINTMVCLLKALEGKSVVVELRGHVTVTGRLDSVESTMSLMMSHVVWKDVRGRQTNMDKFYIKGKQIVYVHIPDDVNIVDAMKWQLNKKDYFQRKQAVTKQKISKKRKDARDKRESRLIQQEAPLEFKSKSIDTTHSSSKKDKLDSSNNRVHVDSNKLEDNSTKGVSSGIEGSATRRKEIHSHHRKDSSSERRINRETAMKNDRSYDKEVSRDQADKRGSHVRKRDTLRDGHSSHKSKRDRHDERSYRNTKDDKTKKKGLSEERPQRDNDQRHSRHRNRHEPESISGGHFEKEEMPLPKSRQTSHSQQRDLRLKLQSRSEEDDSMKKNSDTQSKCSFSPIQSEERDSMKKDSDTQKKTKRSFSPIKFP